MPTVLELWPYINKIKKKFTQTGRNNDESDDDDDTEEIDGIDAPTAGTTVENPPDGGRRAWSVVFSCCIISAMMGTIQFMLQTALTVSVDDTQIDDVEEALEIYQTYLSLGSVFGIVASVSMTTLGYELTIHIGSWCMGLAFLILSYIENIHGIKFLLYIIAGIGSGFVQLGILVPVLEYFTTKRMRALMITKMSRYLGLLLAVIIQVVDEDLPWDRRYRTCMGLCIIIGLVGFTVPSLKMKMKSDGRTTFVAKTLGIGQMDVIKNALFWCVCILFFLYQIAIEPPYSIITNIETALRFQNNDQIAFLFGPFIGFVIGAILGWLFKRTAKGKCCGLVKEGRSTEEIFRFILILMTIMTMLMGIMCFIVPAVDKVFPYLFTFSIVFSTQLALIEELRDDSVPDLFGRQNVKFVEGSIQLCVGIGGLIGSESASTKISTSVALLFFLVSGALSWNNSFRMGGGMMFVTTAFAVILVYLQTPKGAEYIQAFLTRIRNKTGVQILAGSQGSAADINKSNNINQNRHVQCVVVPKSQTPTLTTQTMQEQGNIQPQREMQLQGQEQEPVELQNHKQEQIHEHTQEQLTIQRHAEIPGEIQGQSTIQNQERPIQEQMYTLVPGQILVPNQTLRQIQGQNVNQANTPSSIQMQGRTDMQPSGHMFFQGPESIQTQEQMPYRETPIQRTGQNVLQQQGALSITRRKSVKRQSQTSIPRDGDTPVNNLRLQHIVSHEPANMKFVLSDQNRTDGFATPKMNGTVSAIKQSMGQYQPGQTVYTSILTSMSPEVESTGDDSHQNNEFDTLHRTINPSLIYSYNQVHFNS